MGMDLRDTLYGGKRRGIVKGKKVICVAGW